MEMAALSLLVSTVSPIINMLGSKAASYFGGDVTPEELQNLQTIIIPKILTVIREADKIDPATLRPWLKKLEAAAYEAEDILDMYEYQRIKNKVSPLPTSLKKLKGKAKEFFAPALLKTSLRRSLEKLQQSAKEADPLIPLLRLVTATSTMQRDTTSQQSTTTTVSGLSSPVFGRDEECKSLVDVLINDHSNESNSTNKITQHAIYGLGGAGKTTLAQYIYNDERVRGHFSMRIWTHVSRNFDVHRVTRGIIESASQGGEKCADIGNLDALHMKLKEILHSKKFLLVLDDVWCEGRGEWDQLLIPLIKAGNVGSRILITTRMEGVASTLGVETKNIVSLNELRAEDCWSILKHYAFGDANRAIEDRELAAIGEKIVDKLKNSPLAATLVGSLLRRKVGLDAWEKVLKEDLLGGTLDHLLLSFRHLPLHLQRCFAFCSLYPKGYGFCIDELAQLWVAEGFVEACSENGLTAVEKGQQYFDELLTYSFFQRDPNLYHIYVVHDLLHDLAEKVSEGHCCRIEANGPVNIPPTVIHLSIIDELPVSFPDILVLVNLRTFMRIGLCSYGSVQDVFHNEDMFEMLTKLRMLRVLYFRSYMTKLPSSIGKLKCLRYLKLHEVQELPESLGKLYNLQFLLLLRSKIERVPKSFNNLVNLQYLVATENPVQPYYPRMPEIGKLTSLQTLRFYRVDRSREFGIGQLKNLQQLRGSLTIEGLENVKDQTAATEARLNQKKHLDKLILKWGRHTNGDDRADEEVLEGLEPHPNLRELEIRAYQGAKTPSWMLNSQYWLPRFLTLINCPNLTGVLHLPHSLKELRVRNCPELKQLSPFPDNLEELEIYNSPGFESLLSSFITYNDEEDQQQLLIQQNSGRHQPFPLKELKIEDCSVIGEKAFNLSLQKFDLLCILKLKRLHSITSLLMGPNLTALKVLKIEFCENLWSLERIGALPALQKLEIKHCPRLNLMTQSPCGEGETLLPSTLISLSLKDLPKLTWMGNLEKLSSLKKLEMENCPKMESLPNLPSSLEHLCIYYCKNFSSLPVDLEKLSSLVTLEIVECPMMESLSNLPTSLEKLGIKYCENLSSLPGDLEKLSSLVTLTIRGCPKMESLPNLPTSLEKLGIEYCENFSSLPGDLEKLSSLVTLMIRGCPKMESLPNLPTSLEKLGIKDCENFSSLPGDLEKLSSLVTLTMYGCPKMESLSNLPTSLKKLDIKYCEYLLSL